MGNPAKAGGGLDGSKEANGDAMVVADTQHSTDQLHSKIQMEPDTGSSNDPLDSPAVDALYKRVLWRLMPLFCLMVVFNHIDRSNLSFASLQFNADLGFTAQQYSTGGALFFVGFLTFMVPSNLILLRVGARIWLAVLLVGWGAVATCMMFVRGVASFYVLRVLLGAFEAGAFPGMWYHLALFIPAHRITSPYAYLSVAIMVSNVIGAPLAAGLLSMDGLGGLRGWQWLFMLEGIPSVLLGLVVVLVLPNSPRQARWLSPAEVEIIEGEVKKHEMSCMAPVAATRSSAASGLPAWSLVRAALSNPLVHWAALTGFMAGVAAYTYVLWLPIVINGLLTGTALSGLSVAAKAGAHKAAGVLPVLLSTVPYAAGAITTVLLAASSQRRQELFWHTAVPLLLSGVAFLLFTPLTQASAVAGFISLTVVVGLAAAATGVSYALIAKITAGPSQVVGMPYFNTITALGGFVGPFATGAIVASLGSFTYVSIIMGALLFLTGFMVMGMRWYYPRRQRHVASLVHRPSHTPEGEGVEALRSKSAAAMLNHRMPSSTQEARLAAAAHQVVADSSSSGAVVRNTHTANAV